jgi:hypothetical protein
MAEITNSVGAGGKNAPHDVAMVQFMLRALKKYFGGPYTHRFSTDTGIAIVAFQADYGLASEGASPGSATKGKGETPGLIKPGSPTWQALAKAFDADAKLRDARTAEGFGLAYESMTQAKLSESVGAIQGAKNLQAEFRTKIVELVKTVFKQSGIVWSLVPQTGGWRTFDDQRGLTSDAGYGESVHQYGYAVDLTVANFMWFAPDLRVHKSPIRLEGMAEEEKNKLFALRDAAAATLKLFHTVKKNDQYHLQNLDDFTLDSVSSLMALMHKVGPNKMKWKPQYQTPTDYLCDLGLNGPYFYVGTSKDIWTQDATERISAADLTAALVAKAKTNPKFSPDAFLSRKGVERGDEDSTDVTEADIKAVQKMLRAEFDAAATNWKQWEAVKYPSSERRPKNPRKH